MPWPSITEGVTKATKGFFEAIKGWTEEEVALGTTAAIAAATAVELEALPPVQTQLNTLQAEYTRVQQEIEALQGGSPLPTITNPGQQETVEGTPVELQIVATNATGYSATFLPTGLSINPASGLITGTPAGPPATYGVTAKVIGPGGTTYTGFFWKVLTLAGGAVVTTEPAKAVTAQSAELTGLVNPKGVHTKYRFQYGPTTSYGSQTTEEDAGSGTAAVATKATIKGTGVYLGAALDYAGVVSGSYDKGSPGSYVATFLAHFDSWTPENALKMQATYNSGGRSIPTAANVTKFREMFEALHTANGGVDKLVRAHNLVWPKNEVFSEWVTNPTVAWTATTLKEAFKNYIQSVMTAVVAVNPTLSACDVINEAVSDEGTLNASKLSEVLGGGTAITATNPQMIFYAECFKWAHEAAPNAKLFFNEYNVGVPTKEVKNAAVIKFAEVLLALGAPVDGIGMQMHQNTEWSPTKAEVEGIAIRVQALGLEAEITELDMELKGSGTTTTQGELAKHIAEGALAGNMGRLTCWGFSDLHSDLGTSTLTTGLRPLPYNVEEEAKPFGTALAAVRGVPLTSHTHYRLVGYPVSGPSPVYGADMTLGVLGAGKGAQALIGSEQVYTHETGTAAGQQEGAQFTASETSTLTDLYFLLGPGTQHATSIVLGVAAENSGKPGAPSGQGTATGPFIPNQLVHVGGLSIPVVAGTKYWLMHLPLGGTIQYNYASTSGGTQIGYQEGTSTKIETPSTWHNENLGPVGFYGTAGAGPEPPPVEEEKGKEGEAKLIIGVNGNGSGDGHYATWVPNHVYGDRGGNEYLTVEYTQSPSSVAANVGTSLGRGCKPIVIVNCSNGQNLHTLSRSAYAAGVKAIVKACEEAHSGLVAYELLNEPYYKGPHGNSNAPDYAELVRAAYEAVESLKLAKMPVLMVNAFGYYKEVTAEGNQSESLPSLEAGAWTKQVISTLGSFKTKINAWSFHPYGGAEENAAGLRKGLLVVPPLREIIKSAGAGGYNNCYITELGWEISGTKNLPGSEVANSAEQATQVEKALNTCQKWKEAGWLTGVYFYNDGGSSNGEHFGVYGFPAQTVLTNFGKAHG